MTKQLHLDGYTIKVVTERYESQKLLAAGWQPLDTFTSTETGKLVSLWGRKTAEREAPTTYEPAHEYDMGLEDDNA